MKQYFDAEIRLLREAAQEFAEAYPEQAGMLNLTSWHDQDPYIERLLEGVAYLTAQIRQRIDHDIPDFCETLLAQLSPNLLRPFPSATIMQFNARANQLTKTYFLPKGTLIQSQLVGEEHRKIACQFRISNTVKINPITIHHLSIQESQQGDTYISFILQSEANTCLNALDLEDLIFYLHADPASALYLHFALTRNVQQVMVAFPGSDRAPEILGGQENLVPCGFSREETLLSSDGAGSYGFNILLEYFSFREKYWFIKLKNLEKLKLENNCQQLQIQIRTDIKLENDFNLTKDIFRLNCVPAINLFTKSAEPIRLSHERVEYPMVIDAVNRESMALFSVDKVESIADFSGKRQQYVDMHSFLHRRNQDPYYQIYQRNYSGKNVTSVLVVGGHKEFHKETLSCLVTAHNADFPRRFLQENTITVGHKSIPSFIALQNITRPSDLLMPPDRHDFRWTLISHLSLSYQSITDIKRLQEILYSYDWSRKLENQRRIQGIQKLMVQPTHQVYQGALLSGLEFNLTLTEENYLSVADMHLFGWVLHHFFSMYISINMSVTTRLICFPSNKEFTWQHYQGNNFPI